MYLGVRMDEASGGRPPSRTTKLRKPRPARVQRALASKRQEEPGAGTRWRRVKDNWEDLKRLGANENFGTVVGRLHMFNILTEEQASAALWYSTLCGRFDFYHGLPGSKRHAASPAYERGYGSDDEIVKRTRNGTLPAYERRAKRTKKQWQKAQGVLPHSWRDLVEEVAVFDREVHSSRHGDLAKALSSLAKAFGFNGNTMYEKKEGPTPGERATHMAKVLVAHVKKWAEDNKVTIERFRLAARRKEGERGILVYGTRHLSSGTTEPLLTSVYVKQGNVMPEQLDMLLLKACEAEGWAEEKGKQ